MRNDARRLAVLVFVMLGVILVGSRAEQAPPAANPRVITTQGPEMFVSRVVTTGLSGPWEVAWGPDGFLWVTERVGTRVVRINPATGARTVAVTIDEVNQTLAQDGLLGMALHPDLLKGRNRDYVYVAYTYDGDPGAGFDRRMKVRRYTYDRGSEQLSHPVDILTNLPHGTDHGAGRLVFGPDGTLYLSRGDQGSNFLANYCNANRAQDVPSAADVEAKNWTVYQGKILRINPDGSIPSDNPVINGVRSHIFSFGHRNPQGLIFAPGNRLFDSEHGESIDDEVNLVLPGRNYGWPLIAGYQDDQSYIYANWSASAPEPCSSLKFDVLNPPTSVPRHKESEFRVPNFMPPARTFFTVPNGYDFRALGNATVAPAGLEVYTSSAIPGWRNSLLLTTMISGAVFRMRLSDDPRNPVGAPVAYFKTVNRYRDIAVAPDGIHFYVATDADGRTVGTNGALTRELANPNAILEFVYVAPKQTDGPRPSSATVVRSRP
jgi:PQQ-dependent dehydrogenase (s-GDH family)